MLGFINIFKPKGVSSAYVVSKFKKKVRQKCGHMGTLDPLASGVLPIGLNQANRLFDFLLDKTKKYRATFDFAFETPSYDLETAISGYADYLPTKAQIEAVLPEFLGKIEQIPPAYSAKCVDGTRSYKLARRGIEVDLKPKTVEILSFEIVEQLSESIYVFDIECKGGTYIRSLARDLGQRFSRSATMIALERTACGVFNIENSVTIDEFLACDDIEKYIIKPECVVGYESLVLSSKSATRLLNGLKDEFCLDDGLYKVYNENEFWGVGQIEGKTLKMKAFVREL